MDELIEETAQVISDHRLYRQFVYTSAAKFLCLCGLTFYDEAEHDNHVAERIHRG